MKRTSSQLKQLARESLAHRFSLPVMAYIITFGIIMLVNMLLATLFPDTGNSISYLVISFITDLLLSILSFCHVTLFMLSSIFYTAFGIIIGSLLIFAAVVGTVVIRLDFALVTPLYIDNPQTSAIDLLRESHDLMQGNRLRYFVLELSFIPIMLLAVVACFVGLLWAVPYTQMTLLEFYRELVGEI